MILLGVDPQNLCFVVPESIRLSLPCNTSTENGLSPNLAIFHSREKARFLRKCRNFTKMLRFCEIVEVLCFVLYYLASK